MSPLGFNSDDLLKLCCQCGKLRNIVDVVLVRFGLSASWSNLLANHTAILAAEDACLPDPTPDEVIASNSDPTDVRKIKATAKRITSSPPKEPSDATKKTNSQSFVNDVNDVDDQDDARYHSSFTKYLGSSLDKVGMNDFTRAVSVVHVQSFDWRTMKRPASVAKDVVEDASAQGAKGVRVDEDHQVLGNEERLEEDAPDRTRADDDGVEFYLEGSDYFPTIESDVPLKYTKEEWDQIPIPFLDLLNKEIFKDLTACKAALDRSLTLAELLKTETMSWRLRQDFHLTPSWSQGDDITSFRDDVKNANPFVPTSLNGLRAKITQELNELRVISAMIDSRLENIDHTQIKIPPPVLIEQLLNDFIDSPDMIEMDDLESDNESIDTPLVSLLLDSDDELDDGKVLNELDEYGNAGFFFTIIG
ncbi:hypothetical protein Tco_1287617 [Tanacetum coccineum]